MITDQEVTDKYAIYNGDCMEVMETMPNDKIHMSIYSPPFCGLYQYSSNPRDLSNCDGYDDFFEHYRYVVESLYRLTMPGRMTCVHCMDIPSGNTGNDHLIDFPGDIIRLHKSIGFEYTSRYNIWKEPFAVRLRTMAKNLAHKTIVDDSSKCSAVSADYLLIFRKKGENPEPIKHPTGLHHYAGEREVPAELLKYKGHTGKQIENYYSHWIWRQYASAFWDDIRLKEILPFKESRDEDDEKHVHALQLDVIERCLTLWSNPGDKILTPFMGVGSEVFKSLQMGRFGIGIELKPAYYSQAVKNMLSVFVKEEEQLQFDF